MFRQRENERRDTGSRQFTMSCKGVGMDMELHMIPFSIHTKG